MDIVISGSSGFIGSALQPYLAAAGHRVRRLVRPGGQAEPGDVAWDPAAGCLDAPALDGCDAIVHLAGENIGKRWTAARRERIRRSRVGGAALLAKTAARMIRRPAALLSASAVGYYGDRGEEPLTEESPPGEGFLADLCQEWEAACRPAAEAGVRVANLRFGIVLHPSGGALKRMLPAFRLYLGGRLGGGRQFWGWVVREDVLSAVAWALEQEALSGPLNVTSPNPVTNRTFTAALAHALGRPAVLPAPAFALRLAFGRMADETLLASARALPQRLQASGFAFRWPELEPALRTMLAPAESSPTR
jgi:uncharacterized protein (TIGR01777 family)